MATPVFRIFVAALICAIAFHHHAVMTVDAARGMLESNDQVSRPFAIRGSLGPAGQLSDSAICYHTGGVYHGAQATLSVHQLPLVTTTQTSESSIMISKSHWAGVNSIKAGWHVSPTLYGDGHPRLFTFWTTRNDWSNGCYNSLCAGFILNESSPVKPGHILNPVDPNITLAIQQDGDTGDWWLYYHDHQYNYVTVGHWPKQLFLSLDENGADSVVFGGEAFFDKDDDRAPPMGSGYLGTERGRAASFTEMQHIDKYGTRNLFSSMGDFKFYVDNEACYNTKLAQGPLGVFLFFYGGPQCGRP